MPISYIAIYKEACMQTVNEIIKYLIKNQGEIADIVVSYRTYPGELVALANTEDPITAVGLMACVQQVMINRECVDEYEE